MDKGSLNVSFENPTSVFSVVQAVDDFTLAERGYIRRVEFYGLYGSAVPRRDAFTIRVFADSNGVPAMQWLGEFHARPVRRKHTGQFLVIPELGQFEYFEYRVALPRGLKLAAGRYWLSIVHDAPADWGLGPIHPGDGNLHFRDNDSTPWFPSVPGYGIAFRLYGSRLARNRQCW